MVQLETNRRIIPSPVPSSSGVRLVSQRDPRSSEQSPLVAPNHPITTHTRLDPDRPVLSLLRSRRYATVRGGTFLAIFSLASVLPHFLITIITACMINIAQLITTRLGLKTRNDEDPSGWVSSIVQAALTGYLDRSGGLEVGDPITTVTWPIKVIWLFRWTGILALIGMVASRYLVVPTSELDYWDEIKFQIYENQIEESRQLDPHQPEEG